MPMPRILIVEDERITAEDLKKSLEEAGYKVVGISASGEDALSKVDELNPDLVLMDIKLEGEMDGIEAAKRIRAKFGVPVIYLTAYSDEETVQRAKITEPSGYILKEQYGFIRKPFEESELHTAIEITLYRYRIEKRLRNHEQWLSAMLNSMSDAVIATDSWGQVRFMNPVAEDLTGWLEEEAIGKDLKEVFQPVNFDFKFNDKDMGVQNIKKVILRSRDGSTVIIGGNITPITDEQGENEGLVVIFHQCK